MDQLVNRPATETPDSVKANLGLAKDGTQRARPRRWLLVVVALVLITAAALYLWAGRSTETVNYITAPAQTGDLTVEVSATGTLQPLIQVDISSELSGVVRSVAVNENQQVRRGDVLATLDTTRLTAQVERAEASAKAARAKVTEAKTTLKEASQALARASQLSTRGMVADQTLDTAQASADRAQSALESAEANEAIAVADLKLQQADLDNSTIYAPIDGVVLTRSVDPGQTVASSLQAPVLFIIAADLRQMELKAAVDEADIGSVHPGQKARFTVDAFPERRFDADIHDIAFASVTTEGVVTYNARLEVDNEEMLLRPGMTATVSVITREVKDAITVPNAAFRYSPPPPEASGGWSLDRLFMPRMRRPEGQRQRRTDAEGTRTLYLLKDGAPQAARVKTGSTDGESTEILSGLKAGDLVITGTRQTQN